MNTGAKTVNVRFVLRLPIKMKVRPLRFSTLPTSVPSSNCLGHFVIFVGISINYRNSIRNSRIVRDLPRKRRPGDARGSPGTPRGGPGRPGEARGRPSGAANAAIVPNRSQSFPRGPRRSPVIFLWIVCYIYMTCSRKPLQGVVSGALIIILPARRVRRRKLACWSA